MCGAIPPLSQYALMAWCSLKNAQGQIYLYSCKVTPTRSASHFTPEDGGSMDLRNVGILLQHYTASQPRRPRLQFI